MSRPRAQTAGQPYPWRVVRFLVGASLTAAMAPLFVRLAAVAFTAWRDGSGADVYGIVPVLLLPIGILAAYGLSLAIHAIRGTSPPSFALPLATVIALTLGVVVYREGGVAPVIARGGIAGTLLSMAIAGLALVAHVVVHELGHVLAANVVGSQFQMVRLGPILVRRDGGRLRVERNHLRVRGLLGSALSIPARGERFAEAFAVTMLGGPLATIAATLALWLGARFVSPPSSDAEVVLSFVLWHATFVGAFVAVSSLIPIRFRSGFRTDGAKAWLALTARSAGAREALRWMLNATQGRRPRDWGTTAEALAAAADGDPRYAPEVRLAALGVALDTGDVDGADAILARGPGSERQEDLFRQEFALQASLLASLRKGDATVARARLAEVGPTPVRDYPLLAEAAAALAEGRPEEARALLGRWRDAVERSGIPAIRVGNEWAEELLTTRLAEPRSGVA